MVAPCSLANSDRSHPAGMQGVAEFVTLKLGLVTTIWDQAWIYHNSTLRSLLF